jgi:pimeloyl-ACP methyl ester carboxylesterase
MAVYVLVHGAWHGGWVWEKVIPQLEARGHLVYAPDLPGHGENMQSPAQVNLSSYVAEVTHLLQKIAQPVILVGHSMAGVVISQVAEVMPEAIKTLVYLAAFVPDFHGSLVEEEQKALKPNVGVVVKINQSDSIITIDHAPNLQELFYGRCGAEAAQGAIKRLGPQPLKPFLDKVALTEARFGRVPKVYIECLQDGAIAIEDQRRMWTKIPCQVITLEADHSPFFSTPEALVQQLDR